MRRPQWHSRRRSSQCPRRPWPSGASSRWCAAQRSYAPTRWQDPARCIAYLPRSSSGSLEHPRISEEGRQFLADLLTQLTDAQLHDLFEVARFPQRWDPAENPGNAATIEQWVDAFKKKRDEVVNHRCVGER